MISSINLRLATNKELADLRLECEDIGILEICYIETDITLNIKVQDGYIMDLESQIFNGDSSPIRRYYWLKNKIITSSGINEPLIKNIYYVKSSEENNNICVSIEESSGTNHNIFNRKLILSVEKQYNLPIDTEKVLTERIITSSIKDKDLEPPKLRRSIRIYHEDDNNKSTYSTLLDVDA